MGSDSLESTVSINVTIYNKWGNKVFAKNEYLINTKIGEGFNLLPPDTYTAKYEILYKNEVKILIKNFTIF